MNHPLDTPAPDAVASPIRSVLIFCGSRPGHDPRHTQTAAAVGALLGRLGVALVYGGGALGLMGELARAALSANGRVTGVIPRFLVEWEVAQPGLTDMQIVETLHERKIRMLDQADAVLALPGGHGTLDELAEVLSWRNLRLHAKPVWLLGDGDFWNPVIAMLDHFIEAGFSGGQTRDHWELLPDLSALEAKLTPA